MIALNLKIGCFQIKIDKINAQKTVNGNYQYACMPKGCTDSPNTFVRAMTMALAGLQGHKLEVYMDDIVVFAKTLEEHGRRFKNLLDRLYEKNILQLNLKNFNF